MLLGREQADSSGGRWFRRWRDRLKKKKDSWTWTTVWGLWGKVVGGGGRDYKGDKW